VFQELADLNSVQGQTKGLHSIQTFLYSLEMHNLELSKLVGIATNGTPSVIGSKNGAVPVLNKHVHELGPQNELIQYHCSIHHQNVTGKTL